MPGMRDKGSVLLSLLLIILVVYSGLFLFIHISNAQIIQMKYSQVQVRLEMLGHSGIARARWLLKDQPGLYLVDLSHARNLEEKIALISAGDVYRENVDRGHLIIGFSQNNKFFYVLATLSETHNKVSARRFYTCEFDPDTGSLISVQIN